MNMEQWTLLTIVLGSSLGAAAIFWLITQGWFTAARLVRRKPPFADDIMCLPGKHAAEGLRDTRGALAIWLAMLPVSILVAITLLLALGDRAIGVGRTWLLIIASILLAGALGFWLYRLVILVLRRNRLVHKYCAQLAIGTSLRRGALGGNRLFHNIPIGEDVLDHVLLGEDGLFAIHVIAVKRPRKLKEGVSENVEMNDNRLTFGELVIDEFLPRVEANIMHFEQNLSGVVGHAINIRSVVVTPGWGTTPDAEAKHLLLTEKSVVMLTQWKRNEDVLAKDEIKRTVAYLRKACSDPEPV
ncbi:MAG: hypothetical protein V3T39_00430 [Gammaproteobacteria bacterium]